MGQPHFIVFANEKGGTGKSTTAVHTAIALAATGHRVAAEAVHRFLHERRWVPPCAARRATPSP